MYKHTWHSCFYLAYFFREKNKGYNETKPIKGAIMPKYAIRITDNSLDLITVLNNGVRPLVQEDETYFLFEVDSPNTTTAHEIEREDDLYNEDGYPKDTRLTFL